MINVAAVTGWLDTFLLGMIAGTWTAGRIVHGTWKPWGWPK